MKKKLALEWEGEVKKELPSTVELANAVLFCKVSEGLTWSCSFCFRATINLKGTLLNWVDLEHPLLSFICICFQSLGWFLVIFLKNLVFPTFFYFKIPLLLSPLNMFSWVKVQNEPTHGNKLEKIVLKK